MIHATDVRDDFTTYWHLPPPPMGVQFVVGQQEWNQVEDKTVRHIISWHYVDLPKADEQGWMPVPHWWRRALGDDELW